MNTEQKVRMIHELRDWLDLHETVRSKRNIGKVIRDIESSILLTDNYWRGK